MQKITLNADEASKVVRSVQESSEGIAKGAREFKDKVQTAFEASDINFLQAISNGMDQVVSATNKLTEQCTLLQTALSRYVGEVADYSGDTTGLYT